MPCFSHARASVGSRAAQVALPRAHRATTSLAALRPGSSAAAASRSAAAAGRAVHARAAEAPPAAPETALPSSAHGFDLVREEYVAEYGSKVAIFKHRKTGAECMSVSNSDENKTFGVVFRTPVDDSTGIPHILEHSVLNGSRKYPVKEPFVELIKGSLHTFINAFTYPDRTCYPVASTNLQDFYNLTDVYLDAVFHPRCLDDDKVFQQEGWHYELDAAEGDMQFKGVVFNEMKGVYSQPDSMHYRQIQNRLFPDNNYAVDSGGDPEVIPDLSYESFKDFHARYYHPSNARFWFYGDDPVERRLAKLSEYLADYDERTDIQSLVPPQPLFAEPTKHVGYYAAGEQQESGDAPKAFSSVCWVLSEAPLDVETSVAFTFLDYLLVGTDAAPLMKAVNDSGLGESVVGGGTDDTLRQPTFTMGLKGVKAEDVDKVEQLVLEELHAIRKRGFSPGAIEAATNSIEFMLRENNTGRFPRGLSMMLRAMGLWIYNLDPFTALRWEKPLEHLKKRVASGEDVFGDLLDKYLLNNQHRVTVVTLPDSSLAKQIESKEQARLQTARGQMSVEDVEQVIKATKELKQRQETADSAEALATIPSLQVSDLPKEAPAIPTDVSQISGGTTLLTHDLFTSNVLYADVALPLSHVPPRLLPLLPLFCSSLTQMGTERESFVELTERIDRTAGALSVSPMIAHKKGEAEPVALLLVRGKAMAAKSEALFELMRDVLLTAKLDDQPRFKQMVLETKAGMEAGVIGGGHSFAVGRLAAQRGVAAWANEQMGGLDYLFYIRDLAKRVDSEWDAIKADLHALRDAVLATNGSYVNMTADGELLSAAQPHVEALFAALPDAPTGGAAGAWATTLAKANEAILVPTQVNYVGKAVNLYDNGYDLHGSLYVIEKHLGMTHIWDRVRVMGGAYGGFCSFDPFSGNFSFASYRDPNLLDTVAAYDDTPAFLRNIELDSDALAKSIIGTIGGMDSYQLPDAKGATAFRRHLLGVSDEDRQRRRDEVLATSVGDFRGFAEVLEAARGPDANVAAVTSKAALDKAHEAQAGAFEKVTTVM